MSTQNIIIIAAVFIVGFLLMILFALVNKNRKKKEKEFSLQNSGKAILHLYADKCSIDGVKVKDMDFVRGKDLQYVVSLTSGTHTIEAKYSASQPSMGKNVNYTTKLIQSTMAFEAGHEYTITMYFYSPEERKNYYNGDVGEDIYTQALDISSARIGSFNKAYIICYLEK